MDEIVYLNKEYLPLKDAKISVMDRGFMFADGVYEVVPIYGSVAFLPKEHFARLQKNLNAIKVNSPISYDDFLSIINELIKRNAVQPMQSVYLQITRGVCWERKQFVTGLTPTIFVKLEQEEHAPTPKRALKAITVDDLRWGHCDIKGINRLANILMIQKAYFSHMDEAIIIEDEHVLEGCSSNVFIVENNSVITPPLSNRLLNGVTRKIVIDLIKSSYTLLEEDITRARLMSADEVWITSSTKEIEAVGVIDGQIIGAGSVGRIALDIQQKYQQYIDDVVRKNLSLSKAPLK